MLTERSARIAAAHRLLRRSRRTEAGEFLAEGAPAVTEAIGYAREHPGAVLELYVTAAAGARHVDVVRAAFAAGVEVTQVTDRAAAALSDAVTPQGIVARCALPDLDPAPLLGADPKLMVVLVATSDPGNAGTVIRLADAAGADGVILAGDGVDPFNPKAIRASAGSLFHLPVAHVADVDALPALLADAGLSVLATTGHRRARPRPAPPPTASSTCPRPGCSAPRRTACRDDADRAGRRRRPGADLRPRRVAQPGHAPPRSALRQRPRPPRGPLTPSGMDGREAARATPGTGPEAGDRSATCLSPAVPLAQPAPRPLVRRGVQRAGLPPHAVQGAPGTPGRGSPTTAGPPSPSGRIRSARTRRRRACDFDVSCTARHVPLRSAATTSTGRSLPRPSCSSKGTQVQTISPGSGSPSVTGVVGHPDGPIRRGSTSTVADGPSRPGEKITAGDGARDAGAGGAPAALHRSHERAGRRAQGAEERHALHCSSRRPAARRCRRGRRRRRTHR